MTRTRLSSDGRFRWHEDLRVWEPIAPIPAGVTTPDGRYRWDGAKWQVNLVAAEGWSRVAQDEAEGRAWREAEGRQPQLPPRHPPSPLAVISAALLVLAGLAIVGGLVLLVAMAQLSANLNNK